MSGPNVVYEVMFKNALFDTALLDMGVAEVVEAMPAELVAQLEVWLLDEPNLAISLRRVVAQLLVLHHVAQVQQDVEQAYGGVGPVVSEDWHVDAVRLRWLQEFCRVFLQASDKVWAQENDGEIRSEAISRRLGQEFASLFNLVG